MINATGGVPAEALPRVMTTAQVAELLQVSKSFLDKARANGSGPRYLYVGRSVRYRLEEVESWARRQERRSAYRGERA